MLAYLFWHRPFDPDALAAYETALIGFHESLAASGCPGLRASASYRLSAVPWLTGPAVYEDWVFVADSAALDPLNKAGVAPERWDVHAAVASRTELGHGGLYYSLSGNLRPADATRVVWLTRPRGIRYEAPLDDMLAGGTGVMGAWRKQLVFGPAPEFAVVGDDSLALDLPEGWEGLTVTRQTILGASEPLG